MNLKTRKPNKGRFCNNSEIDTLISKRLSVENKAKLFQLEAQNTSSAVFQFESVSLCSLPIITLKLVCQFRNCYQICPCWLQKKLKKLLPNLFLIGTNSCVHQPFYCYFYGGYCTYPPGWFTVVYPSGVPPEPVYLFGEASRAKEANHEGNTKKVAP